MAILIVEHSGKRERATLNGRASIGRTAENDVVIEHPAVSRTHAVIESTDGSYFITDNDSKNGTLVGEELVAFKHPLSEGDRILIGPATLTFHLSDDWVDDPSDPPMSETHAGILMECPCGAQLWVPKEMIGGRGQCQKCGRTLMLGQVQPASAVSVIPAPAPTVSPTVSAKITPPPSGAPASTEQRICSICQWKIESTDEQYVCPACGLVVHADCWTENRGCSAYGCSQVNILDQPDEVSAVMEEIGHPPMLAQRPPFPWEFACLAASVVGSLLGLLMFGALPLLTLLGSAWYLLRNRRQAKARVLLVAMVVSLAGLIAGVLVSCVWWLDFSLHRR